MAYESLNGKVAIVSGAGSGLGRAIARRLAADGVSVLASDIDEASVGQTVKEIADAGGRAEALRADAGAAADVQQTVERACSVFGGVDIMVNNAGIEIVAPLTETTESDWDRLMHVNLKGVWLGIKHGAPAIAQRGGGAIVNLASVAGITGFPALGAYCASKGGVVQLTRVAAQELRPLGIRANAICPGFIETPMVTRSVETFESMMPGTSFDELVGRFQGRLGTPEEVADLAAFLASEDSRFCSGANFVVDGGATCGIYP